MESTHFKRFETSASVIPILNDKLKFFCNVFMKFIEVYNMKLCYKILFKSKNLEKKIIKN